MLQHVQHEDVAGDDEDVGQDDEDDADDVDEIDTPFAFVVIVKVTQIAGIVVER